MEPDALAAALTRLAPRLAPDGRAVARLTRLSGGASQETWAFEVETPAAPVSLILRRRPEGLQPDPERTAALAAEAALIAAAGRAGAPVPAVIHVCTPQDGIGEAYVMARVEGETLGARIVRQDAFAAVRPGLARRCGEVLAAIHAVDDPALEGLRTADARSELDRYEAIYRETGAERPVFELGFRMLRARAPVLERPVLVHGDFRNGNLIVHPQRGLAAVLDWELAHLGDPAEDLGWICVNSWRFGRHDKPVGGFGDTRDLLDGYAAAGGTPVSPERVAYWQALGSLKWGVMCLIMYRSFATGADPSVERAMIGRRASEAEIDLLPLLEAMA